MIYHEFTRRGAVKFPNKAVVNITSQQPLHHYLGGAIYINMRLQTTRLMAAYWRQENEKTAYWLETLIE
jgi:hypothetical protein